MSQISKKILFFVTLSLISKENQCRCRQSYLTTCDSLSDFFRLKFDGTMHDFLVKCPTSHYICDTVPLDTGTFFNSIFLFGRDSVTVIGQCRGIINYYSPSYYENYLKYLTFYDNHFPKLEEGCFPKNLNLKKFSLVNNRIERIEKRTFTNQQIEELDLSNNMIEIIEKETFNNSTEVLLLRRNNLAFIETNCLPTGLEILSLSDNQLIGLEYTIFDSLISLKQLYLHHNKLRSMPNIGSLSRLKVLDVSHNKIETVEEATFAPVNNILMLDLSHNKIKNLNFLPIIIRNSVSHPYSIELEVRLHFNLFRETKHSQLNWVQIDDPTNEVALWLHGNPWWCSNFTSFEKLLRRYGMRLSDCDLQHLNKGVLPFCISDEAEDVDYVTQKFFEMHEQNKNLVNYDFSKELKG